jgi:hypothetical protein
MFTFGSQINPALGRQDFSAILQGGQARAQGIARAGEIQGQAIAQVAETLGRAGIQAAGTYFQNKEKNAVLEGKNAQLFNALASDPSTNGAILRSPTIQKAIAQRDQKGGLDLSGNTKLFAELSTAYDLAKERQDLAQKKIYSDAAAQQARLQLEEANRLKAEREKTANFFTEVGALGRAPTAKDMLTLGISNGLPVETLRSMYGLAADQEKFSQDVQESAARVALVKQQAAEAKRRVTAYKATAERFGENGYISQTADDGSTIYQFFDPVSGSVKTDVVQAKDSPASVKAMEARFSKTREIMGKYLPLLDPSIRGTPEAIKQRNELAEEYNIYNKDPAGTGFDRQYLDNLWNVSPSAVEVNEPVPTGKGSNIKNVSNAPAGAKPTAAAAPGNAAATTPASPFANLGLAASSTGFMGGSQPFAAPTQTSTLASTQTSAQDASIGTPVPPPAPNVVLPSRGADLAMAGATTGFMGPDSARLLAIPPRPRPEPSAIPFGMERTEPSFRPVGDVGQEIDRVFEVGAKAVGESAKKVSRNFVNQVVPELKKGAEVTLRAAKQMVSVPAENFEKMVVPGLEQVGRDGIRLVKALAGIDDYTPSKESISRLPSGKVMSITQILADPEAAGFGPAVAATALTTMQLDPKAKRIANELLEEYERNNAPGQGRAPISSLRPSNAKVGNEDSLYGMPKLRRGDAINQVSERPIAFRPQYSKAELEKSRKESRSLTDKMMRDQEQLRQLEQMMRSRRSRR